MVQKIIRKTFLQLIECLREMNSKIIYASYNKIIIYTNKSTSAECVGYIEYITNAISKKPLFEHINLNISTIWKILLFKDIYNFGGIQENQPVKKKEKVLK
jgi:DNA polymerase epsilon subunit 1